MFYRICFVVGTEFNVSKALWVGRVYPHYVFVESHFLGYEITLQNERNEVEKILQVKNIYAYDGAKFQRKKFFGLFCEKGLKCLVIFSLKVNKKSIMVHPIKLCKVSSHICHHILSPP
jgi:hypothetical protein